MISVIYLHGLIDNVRESPSGKTFWAALPVAATQENRPLIQRLAPYPFARGLLAMVCNFDF